MRHRTTNRAFALIVTVIILALLAVMAVAFLSSSRIERGTARGVADKVKADLAAQSAANTAIVRLIDNLTNYPDSATTWETITNPAGSADPVTVVYYRDKTPEQGAGSPMSVLPLVSGATTQLVASKANSLGAAALDNTNSYDLNHARFNGDTQGWIGAPPGSASRPSYRGLWVNLTDSSNKVTGRYAYWMEDESFKVNANLMQDTLRGSNSLGDAPSQIPLQGMLAMVGYDTSLATKIFDFRKKFPSSLFYEYRALNQADSGQPTLGDSAKFVATIYSGALNLSRSGSKRVNLNKVVSDSTDAATIRNQLDQIIKTITYHLPNFAQRFYRNGSNLNSATDVLAANQTIYLNKVAANIRDYIDTDSQPTVVKADGTVQIGSSPAHPFEASGGGTSGSNEVMAIGKDHVPSVQEYVIRVRQLVLSPRLGTSADYQIQIDHYVEFWNPYNRDITLTELGPNPFLLIADQPGWNAGTMDNIPEGAGPPSRDLKLYLNTATSATDGKPLTVFPAGSVTVLTTDSALLDALTPPAIKSRIYQIPIPPPSPNPLTYGSSGTTDLHTYSGKTNLKSSSQLRLNLLPRSTPSSDYLTEIALGNDLGMLESAWGAGALTSTFSINADLGTDNRFDTTIWHFQGAYLKGNIRTSSYATPGDSRTNCEQLKFDLNGSSANNDKTRYFDESLDSKSVPGNSTLGAPNSAFVDPSKWPDFSSTTPSANDAPAVITNAPLKCIGQLGDIFDPVRTKGDSNDITLSRSGGRTFRIGQPERYDAGIDTNTSRAVNLGGLWDGDSNSASREWTAWRLTDVFTTSDPVQLDGRVNINGVNRDGGAALKAALYGYNFAAVPDSDPNLAGKAFDADPPVATDKVNELIKQLQARIKNDQAAYSAIFKNTAGPFGERGELSEMPIFNTGKDLDSSIVTGSTYDRGREELFRRLAELTTTRGNIFTVYAAGQSLVPQSSGTPIVTSTSQLKVTFRIDPVWNAGTPSDPFDPTTGTRFSKPDKYAIKILYAGE